MTELKYLPAEDLEVNELYYVHFSDCCVMGEFTSTLAEVVHQDEPYSDAIKSLRFGNGVTLHDWGQVWFSKAELADVVVVVEPVEENDHA